MTKITDSLTLPCGQIIKNRVCKAAMTERIALGNNFTNEKHIELYRKWGAGDIGILLTGNVQVHRENLEGPANIAIEENSYQEQLPMLKKWAEVSKAEGSKVWMQISHAGRQTPGEINMSPMSPSSVQLKIPGRKYGKPVPMTEEDIQDVIRRFVFTAKVARESGFDGIQLHSAHGYLLSQFLSPDINQRTDAWGGTIENRTRIHLEIIKRCREEVGSDFAISVKMNSADFQKGGFSSEDSIEVAKILSNSGIDNLEISGGTYEQPRLLGLDKVSINPERSENRRESTVAREAYFLSYAEKIAEAVDIPLMVTGGFRTKEGMEAALGDGACQIVGVGRPLCANPYAIKELLNGEINQLPKFEKTLSIGPWLLSPSSPFRLIQAINAFSAQAWFYQQIKFKWRKKMKVENAVMPNEKQMEEFLEEGHDKPIFMVNLLKFKDQAQYPDKRETNLSGKEAYAIYGKEVQGHLEKVGGKGIFGAEVTRLMLGEVEDLWDQVAIAMYPNRKAMLKMISDPDYIKSAQHRVAGLAGQLNIETDLMGTNEIF